MNKILRIILIIIALAVFVIILAKVRVPYNVRTKGVIFPVREWILVRTTDGNFVSNLKNYKTGTINSGTINELMKVENSQFIANSAILFKNIINEGDTIGKIISSESDYEIETLEGELEVQNGMLKLFSSGKKMSDVEEATDRLLLAKHEFESQKKIAQRNETLFTDSLISEIELENSQNLLKIKELNVKIAESYQRSVSTGDKPEQIQIITAKIKTIKDQLRILQEKSKHFTLISPISGYIVKKKKITDDYSVVFEIADTSQLVMLLPIEYFEKQHIELDQTVELILNNQILHTKAKIISIDNSIQLFNGKQGFYVSALLENLEVELIPGFVVNARVHCDKISIPRYVYRMTKPVYN